jgi:hypothetical protein
MGPPVTIALIAPLVPLPPSPPLPHATTPILAILNAKIPTHDLRSRHIFGFLNEYPSAVTKKEFVFMGTSL